MFPAYQNMLERGTDCRFAVLCTTARSPLLLDYCRDCNLYQDLQHLRSIIGCTSLLHNFTVRFFSEIPFRVDICRGKKPELGGFCHFLDRGYASVDSTTWDHGGFSYTYSCPYVLLSSEDVQFELEYRRHETQGDIFRRSDDVVGVVTVRYQLA